MVLVTMALTSPDAALRKTSEEYSISTIINIEIGASVAHEILA
jgi:hypothetical protein